MTAFPQTVINACKHCERDAMPNTHECIDHHNERLDALWAGRWARFETEPFEEGNAEDEAWTPELAAVVAGQTVENAKAS